VEDHPPKDPEPVSSPGNPFNLNENGQWKLLHDRFIITNKNLLCSDFDCPFSFKLNGFPDESGTLIGNRFHLAELKGLTRYFLLLRPGEPTLISSRNITESVSILRLPTLKIRVDMLF
jgi:hypothetical protein